MGEEEEGEGTETSMCIVIKILAIRVIKRRKIRPWSK